MEKGGMEKARKKKKKKKMDQSWFHECAGKPKASQISFEPRISEQP